MPWSSPPNFSANAQGVNQIFSAAGHGQALLNNANHLLGLYRSANVPTTHYPEYIGTLDHTTKWVRVWDGWIVKQADLFGAVKTPHVYIFNAKGERIYSGGASNSRDPKKANKFYLEEVLEDLAAGKPPRYEKTRVLGCYIER